MEEIWENAEVGEIENNNSGQEERNEERPSSDERQSEPGIAPRHAAIREPQSEEEKDLVQSILEKRNAIAENRPKLRALRQIERVKIMSEVKKLDNVLDCVERDTKHHRS